MNIQPKLNFTGYKKIELKVQDMRFDGLINHAHSDNTPDMAINEIKKLFPEYDSNELLPMSRTIF